jgi:hypothetical protein
LEEEVHIAEKYEAMARKEDATASNMRQPTHKDSTPSTSRPRHKLPHLTKYSGRRDEWTTWQLQALLKISADGDAIGDSQDQIAYLYSSMEGEAQNRLTIWVTQAIASGACDAEAFMKAAAAAFADPNEQRNALTKLSSMRQGKNEPLHIFLPRFESTLARAGGLSWTSSVQINYLEQALNDETARHLVTVGNHNKEFNEYKEILLTIDARLQQLRSRPVISKYNPRPTNGKSATVSVREDHQPSVAEWVSKETLNHRREHHQCLRCGGSNHVIKHCPIQPAKRPLRAANAQTDETVTGALEQGKE